MENFLSNISCIYVFTLYSVCQFINYILILNEQHLMFDRRVYYLSLSCYVTSRQLQLENQSPDRNFQWKTTDTTNYVQTIYRCVLLILPRKSYYKIPIPIARTAKNNLSLYELLIYQPQSIPKLYSPCTCYLK